MASEGSVTRWLDPLREGDQAAVRQLWDRYFPRLVGLARQRLRAAAPPRAADEEDVALSAFDSFCRAAEAGRFPNLHDRDSLWRLLVAVTANKAANLLRDEGRQKRGGGATVAADGPTLEQFLGREPTPEFAAQVAEECRRLLALLGDRELESVAVWKMEGFTVEEIADRLGYAPRSVKRKLQLIRDRWSREVPP